MFRRSETEHALLLALHHIVADFWSIAVLLDELGQIYPAELAGDRPRAPRLAAGVRRLRAVAEIAVVDGPEGERHWSYWREQLAGALPVLEPADRPAPAAGPDVRGATRLVHLDAGLTPRLAALSAGATGRAFTSTLLAAFQALVSRATAVRTT